jgi:hypothetical protein
MKIRSVGAELFHGNGRTDTQTGMTKGNICFIFAILRNAPKPRHTPVAFSEKDYTRTGIADTDIEDLWLQGCDTLQSS